MKPSKYLPPPHYFVLQQKNVYKTKQKVKRTRKWSSKIAFLNFLYTKIIDSINNIIKALLCI